MQHTLVLGGRRGLAVVARRHRSPFGGGPETLWSHYWGNNLDRSAAQLGVQKPVIEKQINRERSDSALQKLTVENTNTWFWSLPGSC